MAIVTAIQFNSSVLYVLEEVELTCNCNFVGVVVRSQEEDIYISRSLIQIYSYIFVQWCGGGAYTSIVERERERVVRLFSADGLHCCARAHILERVPPYSSVGSVILL